VNDDGQPITTPVPQLESDLTLLTEEACPDCGDPAVVERSKLEREVMNIGCSDDMCGRFQQGQRPWTAIASITFTNRGGIATDFLGPSAQGQPRCPRSGPGLPDPRFRPGTVAFRPRYSKHLPGAHDPPSRPMWPCSSGSARAVARRTVQRHRGSARISRAWLSWRIRDQKRLPGMSGGSVIR
jgi:hypothetical protein